MKIAVIGCGASGLTCIKNCKEEGFEPVCFERTDNIGGLWHYTDEAHEGQACVMKSTTINTSKEMMCFSDCPIPEEYPNFMHNTRVMDYFRCYAREFDLMKHIRFRHEITCVSMAGDYDVTGCWDVEFKNRDTGEVTKERFDGVMVATGHHADVHSPTFPGMKDFKGKVIHSHDYKNPRGYEDKSVVVVGVGNSGGDVAVELSKISKKVYLSTRRGMWLFKRLVDGAWPGDIFAMTRFNNFLSSLLPWSLQNRFLEQELNRNIDHEKFGLKPDFRALSAHALISDDLPNRIISGNVVIKPNIERFTQTGVVFDDGTREDEVDIVIMATGYKFGFPFIDSKAVSIKDNRNNFYKFVFPVEHKHHTLAIVGCVQPVGSTLPMAEMHARLALSAWKGRIKLPSKEEMLEDIADKRRKLEERYIATQRHTMQVDFVPYLDELAEMIGCKPNIMRLILTDPILAKNVILGPCSPVQYRLEGPGAWPGARKALLSQQERLLTPIQTRPVKASSSHSSCFLCFLLMSMFVVLLGVLCKSFCG